MATLPIPTLQHKSVKCDFLPRLIRLSSSLSRKKKLYCRYPNLLKTATVWWGKTTVRTINLPQSRLPAPLTRHTLSALELGEIPPQKISLTHRVNNGTVMWTRRSHWHEVQTPCKPFACILGAEDCTTPLFSLCVSCGAEERGRLRARY